MVSPAPHSSSEGSGTIATIGIIACILLLGLALLAAASIRAQTTRVQAIADLAALAGAECAQNATLTRSGSAADGGQGCACAREVATLNGPAVEQCWQEGQDLRIVLVQPWAMLRWTVEIRAMARAGPL